ncbi:AAA family ATPase [Candidatus Chromulinivorax destructor]|uniref:AAA family ATPase n=1 Tax=Candidatus Chromulinivorax destructor TaxID=2066483 RepID=A0A345ZC85_9BACT|nr:AAA family ATPase [Candidatus Chromulinivorax destructor]AXK60902.1 hypothetical protein C0J27_04110 [Candidatus Chromulinivorax destructor]
MKKLKIVVIISSFLYGFYGCAVEKIKNNKLDGIQLILPQDNRVRLDDLIGNHEIKQAARSIIAAFKDQQLYASVNKNFAKSFLLQGCAGNGKKMLAQAFAGETGSSILQLSGASLINMTPEQVHELFTQAKLMAPCVIVIDDVADFILETSEQAQQVMRVYLDEMDRLDEAQVPIMIFGTLIPQEDQSYNITGLFDFTLYLSQPSFQDRVEFLDAQLKDFKKNHDVDYNTVARLMIGRSYKDFVSFIDKIKNLTSRASTNCLSPELLDEAISYINQDSQEGFHIQTPEEQYASAIHEAGHAMIVMHYESQCRLHSVSVKQNSRSYGRMIDIALTEPYLQTEDELLYDITVALGGGVAEQIFNVPETKNITQENGLQDFISRSSVASDFEILSTKAHKIVKQRCLHAGGSCEACSAIDGEKMVEIVQACYEKATKIIVEHKQEIEQLAQLVLEKETVYADEAYAICGKKKPRCDFEKISKN